MPETSSSPSQILLATPVGPDGVGPLSLCRKWE